MFRKNVDGFYQAEELSRLSWLRHGFGTRQSDAPAGRTATLRQVHSSRPISSDGRDGCAGEADALIDTAPGLLLAVKTADCLPILLVDERQRAAAAIHAGWRGTAGRIAPASLTAMAEKYGTVASDISAAIGPGIGPCCFEVGPEVAIQLAGIERRMRIDLADINRRQLEEAGVEPTRIYSAGLCTACNIGEFFSFRRERERAGRMWSFAGIAPAGPS